ncbi:MAG: hypothetical protein RR483_00940 [Clostridia bacterium]
MKKFLKVLLIVGSVFVLIKGVNLFMSKYSSEIKKKYVDIIDDEFMD